MSLLERRMETPGESSRPPGVAEEPANARLESLGRWGGLVLFAALLALPPLESMRDEARVRFASRIPGETATVLQRWQSGGQAGDPDAYRRAEEAVVSRHARVMQNTAAVVLLVAIWWICLAVPIAATSLLPLFLFPLLGVVPVGQVARSYADSTVFLFLGGFIIALAIERCGLHRRIALSVVRLVGVSESGVVLGFMLATGLVSMWISNTATAMMMLPIGLAVITVTRGLAITGPVADRSHFPAALMLGIAYAASIGGMGTPIGTPPNIVFLGQYHTLFPDAPQITFAQWMLMGVPLSLAFLIVAWLLLTRVTCPVERTRFGDIRRLINEHRRALGPVSRDEKLVAGIFCLTAVLWATRSLPVAAQTDLGWAAALERWLDPAPQGVAWFRADYVNDATVALGMALLLFILPGHRGADGTRGQLINWDTAKHLPWDVLLLFGGGFALASGLQESGLDQWCSRELVSLGGQSPWVLVPAACLLVTFLSEIASNTATAQIVLPIIAQLSKAAGVHPLLLMVPATLAASCGFMLPVATPPNAIAFGSGYVRMGWMVRSGFLLNLIGTVLITATTLLLVRPVLGLGNGLP